MLCRAGALAKILAPVSLRELTDQLWHCSAFFNHDVVIRNVASTSSCLAYPKPGASSIKKAAQKYRRNQDILARQLQVIFPDGDRQQLSKDAAIHAASSLGLDLVEVNSSTRPPTAKILDFSAFRYQKEQAAKEVLRKARLKEKKESPKEMRFTTGIADHDLEVKLKKVSGFLDDGFKVALSISSSSQAEMKAAQDALDYMLARLNGVGEPDSKPVTAKRCVTLTVRPVAIKATQ